MKTVVIILLLIIIGAGGFYLGQKYKLVPATTTTETTPATTQTLPTVPTVTQTITAMPTPAATVDETATLMAAVKAGLITEHGQDAGNMNLTVSLIQGNYAKGMANGSGGGGIWFAAKVNGMWKLVWDGNGIIQCSDLTNYPDFPNTLIPECYNMSTQQNVVR